MQVRSRLPNSRVVATSPATADRVGMEPRIRYESSESIRQITDETGYGITRVRGSQSGPDIAWRVCSAQSV